MLTSFTAGYNLDKNCRGNVMNKLLIVLLACLVVMVSCNPPAPVEKLRVLSEEYPPYNYTDEQGVFTGTSTARVQGILDKLGLKVKIEVMPWARAYDIVQSTPNVALYSMARTPEREHNFLWVGPVGSYELWLYAKKGSGVMVNSLDDAKTVKAIAAVRNDDGQLKLAAAGFINFVFTDSIVDGLKKLMAGDADLWLGARADVDLVANKAGVDPAQLEPAVLVGTSDIYIAFNKNTPYETILKWQDALDSLKK